MTIKQMCIVSILTVSAVLCLGFQAHAQTTPQTTGSTTRSSVLSTGGGQALIDPSDTVILLLDHQSGLFQTVKDISVSEWRANTVALAKLATLLKIPVITTASEPNGPKSARSPQTREEVKRDGEQYDATVPRTLIA